MILTNIEVGKLQKDLEDRFRAEDINIKMSVRLVWQQGFENRYENSKIVPVISFGFRSFLCPEGVVPHEKCFDEIYDRLFSIIHFFMVGYKEAKFSPILDVLQIHGVFFDATEQKTESISEDSTLWLSLDGNSLYLLNQKEDKKILYQLFTGEYENPVIGKTVAIMTEFGLQEETVMKEMRLSNKVDFRRNFEKEERRNAN